MSIYDFNPRRCKEAVEALASLAHDADDEECIKAIEALILDIEALHRLASERDQIRDSVYDLLQNSFAGSYGGRETQEGELEAILDNFDWRQVEPLSL